MRKVSICSAIASLCVTSAAQAVPVDLELELLTDVSGSVSSGDFSLIQDGYAAAFRNGNVQDAIVNGSIGSIAVGVGVYGSSFSQSVDWTLIDSVAVAESFADEVETLSRGGAGTSTSPTAGLNGSVPTFGSNGFEGTRQVIDVTGDGAENVAAGCPEPTFDCEALQQARDDAVVAGIDQINALLIDDRNFFGDDPGDRIDAVPYAELNLLAGEDSFAEIVQDFNEFGPAFGSKLEREVRPGPEISPIPLPAGVPLLLSGIGALGALRLRRKAA